MEIPWCCAYPAIFLYDYKCLTIYVIAPRTASNAKRLFLEWEDKHGRPRAQQCAGTMPARPLRGRWGSATRAEARIILAGRDELIPVFTQAMDRASKKD